MTGIRSFMGWTQIPDIDTTAASTADDSPFTGSSSVLSWRSEALRLNSSYNWIDKAARISSTAPACRQISQDTWTSWEKSTRESSVICHHDTGFNRCLYRVQVSLQRWLKIIQAGQCKGKSAGKVCAGSYELHYQKDFDKSISQAMAKTMEHLSDFVFVSMANLTLARLDSYLSHLRLGIKPDILAAYIVTLKSY